MPVPQPDDFTIFVPATFLEKGGKRLICGFVTTEHEDRETETVLQDGLDFEEFLKYGYFNDNHSGATRDLLGYPTKIEPRETPDGRRGH